MLTKEQAVTAGRFHHVSRNQGRNGECLRVRRNGATQTWVTRPTEWRIPIKWGMRDYSQIYDHNAAEWNVADNMDVCERCRPAPAPSPGA